MCAASVLTINEEAFRVNCPQFEVGEFLINTWFVHHEMDWLTGLSPFSVELSLDELKGRLIRFASYAVNELDWRLGTISRTRHGKDRDTRGWTAIWRRGQSLDFADAINEGIGRDDVTITIDFDVPVWLLTTQDTWATPHVAEFFDVLLARSGPESSIWRVHFGSFGFSLFNRDNDWSVMQILKSAPDVFEDLCKFRNDVPQIEAYLETHRPIGARELDWGACGIRVPWPGISQFDGNRMLADKNAHLT